MLVCKYAIWLQLAQPQACTLLIIDIRVSQAHKHPDPNLSLSLTQSQSSSRPEENLAARTVP